MHRLIMLVMLAGPAMAYEVERSGGTVYVCVDSAGEVPPSNHLWKMAVILCGLRAPATKATGLEPVFLRPSSAFLSATKASVQSYLTPGKR